MSDQHSKFKNKIHLNEISKNLHEYLKRNHKNLPPKIDHPKHEKPVDEDNTPSQYMSVKTLNKRKPVGNIYGNTDMGLPPQHITTYGSSGMPTQWMDSHTTHNNVDSDAIASGMGSQFSAILNHSSYINNNARGYV